MLGHIIFLSFNAARRDQIFSSKPHITIREGRRAMRVSQTGRRRGRRAVIC